MLVRVKVLEKLNNDPNCPTSSWVSTCAGALHHTSTHLHTTLCDASLFVADGSSCLLELPTVDTDGSGARRYRCKTCWDAFPGNRDDRLPGRMMRSTQMNLVWKHMASGGHFSNHLVLNPLSDKEKYERVLAIIPKLRWILSRKTNKSDKVYFTTTDVENLETQVMADPAGAYIEAFKFGMQGNMRGAKTIEHGSEHYPQVPNDMPSYGHRDRVAQAGRAAQSQMHTNNTNTYQHPPQLPTHPPPIERVGQVAANSSFYGNQSEPVAMGFLGQSSHRLPNQQGINDLSQMYKSTQTQSAQFHSFTNPKS